MKGANLLCRCYGPDLDCRGRGQAWMGSAWARTIASVVRKGRAGYSTPGHDMDHKVA